MISKEALQELKKLIPFKEELTDKVLECENIIEKDLGKLETSEKVKEILKKKYFHTLDIITDDYQNYWCMCNNESINPDEIATEEEYYFVQDYLSK